MEKSRRAATECPFVRDTKTPIVETKEQLEYGVFIDGPFERSEINTDSPVVMDDDSALFYLVCHQSLAGHHHGVYGTRTIARAIKWGW